MTSTLNDPNSKLNDPSSKLGPERLCKHVSTEWVMLGNFQHVFAACDLLKTDDEQALNDMKSRMSKVGLHPADGHQCMFGGRQPCPFFNWEPEAKP